MEAPCPSSVVVEEVLASDFEVSEAFCAAALGPLGFAIGYRADGVAEYCPLNVPRD